MIETIDEYQTSASKLHNKLVRVANDVEEFAATLIVNAKEKLTSIFGQQMTGRMKRDLEETKTKTGKQSFRRPNLKTLPRRTTEHSYRNIEKGSTSSTRENDDNDKKVTKVFIDQMPSEDEIIPPAPNVATSTTTDSVNEERYPETTTINDITTEMIKENLDISTKSLKKESSTESLKKKNHTKSMSTKKMSSKKGKTTVATTTKVVETTKVPSDKKNATETKEECSQLLTCFVFYEVPVMLYTITDYVVQLFK